MFLLSSEIVLVIVCVCVCVCVYVCACACVHAFEVFDVYIIQLTT